MTAPQLSPGGQWWWTGDAWVAAADHPDGAAALAALQAAAVPAQPAPAPAPVAEAVAESAAAVLPQVVAPAPEPYRPVGWAPPASEVPPPATKAPARTSLGKPLAIGAAVVGGTVLLTLVVMPLISGAQKKAADTVQKPIAAADRAVLQIDANSAAQAELASFNENGRYVGMSGLTANGYRPSPGVHAQVVRADATGYCLKLTDGPAVGWVSSPSNQLRSAPCR